MWDLIVSVPDHCFSFYFKLVIFIVITENNMHNTTIDKNDDEKISVNRLPIIH